MENEKKGCPGVWRMSKSVVESFTSVTEQKGRHHVYESGGMVYVGGGLAHRRRLRWKTASNECLPSTGSKRASQRLLATPPTRTFLLPGLFLMTLTYIFTIEKGIHACVHPCPNRCNF